MNGKYGNGHSEKIIDCNRRAIVCYSDEIENHEVAETCYVHGGTYTLGGRGGGEPKF